MNSQEEKAAARIRARDRQMGTSTPTASQTHVHSNVDGRVIDQPRTDAAEPTPGSCVDRLNKAEAAIAALVEESGRQGSTIAALDARVKLAEDAIADLEYDPNRENTVGSEQPGLGKDTPPA